MGLRAKAILISRFNVIGRSIPINENIASVL